MKKEIKSYLIIILGSVIYALGTVLFIFPHSLLLGGTSGISVILNSYLSFSPGTILMAINFSLLVLAFIVLGRNMAIKTFIGSTLTTLFVGLFENFFNFGTPVISNCFLSAVLGAAVIALASGLMFYVDSSSGGTDIIALIVKKYVKINIGKALLITDFLIVIIGGILSGYIIAVSSFAGLLIKTFGIDYVIAVISKKLKEIEE
ncbi:MAG: YitT family protein [Clostridia bacterium]|nr:YitT family protein [Clostridia bacterium]